MSEIGQIKGNSALVQLAARYEALVRDFGLLRELEALEGEALTPNDACTRLAAMIPTQGIAEHCSIMLLDGEGSYLELRAVGTRYSTQGFALNGEIWHGKRFALGEGVAGQVAATGVHVRIQDTLADPHFLRLPESAVSVRSLMCFPLFYESVLLGVLNLSHSEPGFFDLDRERALLVVSQRMARILGRALSPAGGESRGALVAILDLSGRPLQLAGACDVLTGAPVSYWLERPEAWGACLIPRGVAGVEGDFEFHGPDGHVRRLRATALPAGPGVRCVLIERAPGPPSVDLGLPSQAASRLLHAQRIHILGQLAGGVVHELGNLLQGIAANLDLALTAPAQQDMADLIARSRAASLRGAEIVTKVVDFGRGTANGAEQVIRAPGTLLEETAAMLRCAFDPGIVLHVESPSGLWPICVDAGQVQQALMNLGMNARDALEDSEGRHFGGPGERRVVLGAENVRFDTSMPGPRGVPIEGEFVRLFVSDNGAGMMPDVLARAFEPFFTTRAAGRGTGLGLSTVYRIVRGHRGWLDLQSTPRRGTTASIYLPALPAERIGPSGAEAAAAEDSGPALILLVDDEALVRNLGAAILKRLGYQVLTARDGGDALAIYEANRGKIRLIILDLQMPDMGGETVLARVRSVEPGLPIIYSTGMTYFEAQDLPPELRPTGLLKKPYLIATMSEIVESALSAGRQSSG